MPRNSAAEVLEALDGEFSAFARAFADGEYLVWIGSGVSRDVVPGLPDLLRQMLVFLKSQVTLSDPSCPYKQALREIVDLATMPAGYFDNLDLTEPVTSWPDLDNLVWQLVDHYSEVLDVPVQGEPDDFLVWTAVKVPTAYGSPTLMPDVEHMCIAILMLEGAIRAAPTTNWDGLVEAAMRRLVYDSNRYLNVVVRPEDLRASGQRPTLIKFHGCAVRAAEDEPEYRKRLMARKSQLSEWTARPENQFVKNYLQHLFATSPALVVGLSVQDPNIHTVIGQAHVDLAWTWPNPAPAVMLAEQVLTSHHRNLLRITYRDDYTSHRNDISRGAVLGAYAKPTLVALLLFTLAEKMFYLASCTPGLSCDSADIDKLRGDYTYLRDLIGSSSSATTIPFIESIVSSVTMATSIYRTGTLPGATDNNYQPISTEPIKNAYQHPDFHAAAWGRAALALAFLGRGMQEGSWTTAPGSAANPHGGVFTVNASGRTTKVFIVSSARCLSELEVAGIVDATDGDTLILLSEAPKASFTRSPKARYGRTGRRQAHEVDLEGLAASTGNVSGLFDAFKLEGAF